MAVPELQLNNTVMVIDNEEVELRRKSEGDCQLRDKRTSKGSPVTLRTLSKRWSNSLLRSKSIGSSRRKNNEESEPMGRQRRAVSMSPARASIRMKVAPCPAPLLIEDPPSSENVSDLEDVKHQIDPALLNGSSSSFGGAGARSAPSTPQGILNTIPGSISEAQPGISPPCSLPRSPSHHIFSKYDKSNLKHLSCSTPVMTAQAHSPEPPSPKAPTKEGKHPTTSRARQKKFIRHFPTAQEELVLNYYSCALIGDILLQGHLYITSNYFAFYSNVFGYVTKLLIPMASVQKISKEKTARIIPNAVGITTFEDKHVFGSLMSRDSTFRYMNQVWDTSKQNLTCELPPEPSLVPSDSDSSETREESGRESPVPDVNTRFRKCVKPAEVAIDKTENTTLFRESYFKLATASKQSVLLFTTTFILILLFLSAAVLLYRIGRVQSKYTQALQDNFVMSESPDVYGELLQWQTHLHSKSAGAVHSFLDTNLDQIAKVRQSLEALSTLLIPNGHSASQNSATKPLETPDNS